MKTQVEKQVPLEETDLYKNLKKLAEIANSRSVYCSDVTPAFLGWLRDNPNRIPAQAAIVIQDHLTICSSCKVLAAQVRREGERKLTNSNGFSYDSVSIMNITDDQIDEFVKQQKEDFCNNCNVRHIDELSLYEYPIVEVKLNGQTVFKMQDIMLRPKEGANDVSDSVKRKLFPWTTIVIPCSCSGAAKALGEDTNV